ncbi:MAG: IS91 family transposase [Phycisphaerae bacterium]|nr:IS91 family transposase [Phycisphaerae bacterium]
MGTRIYLCEHCGQTVTLPNSCGDRHCPKCQAGKRAAWLAKRREELLPVEYFQVVFTVPEELNILAAAHPKVFYTLLFRAVKDTLLEVAASAKHLRAAIGGLMVLHTWGQNLHLHPHVHVILPGGGLSPDGQRWVACPRGFFLPNRVLSEVFRGKLLDFIKQEHAAGQLPMTGGLADLADPGRFMQWLSPRYQTDWVVHTEPSNDRDPQQALKYLARYTYRVAISNDRIESIDRGQVTFRYKDYARGGRWRRMTLSAEEFLRRFLQHVLPTGFVRIRAFGFLANRHRAEKLMLIRRLLGASELAAESAVAPIMDDRPCCPHCAEPALRLLGETARPSVQRLVESTYPAKILDSS